MGDNEKLLLVLGKINVLKKITTIDQNICLDINKEFENEIRTNEITEDEIMGKLELLNDENDVIDCDLLKRDPVNDIYMRYMGIDGDIIYRITVRDGFDEYYNDHKKKERNRLETKKEKSLSKEDEIVYEIAYRGREISINSILLAKPDFMSENDEFFDYVYKKQNKRISIEEIEKYKNRKFKKTPHQIIKDLGFTGDIARAFFDISQKGVFFRNPVTRNLLNELRINSLKIKPKK